MEELSGAEGRVPVPREILRQVHKSRFLFLDVLPVFIDSRRGREEAAEDRGPGLAARKVRRGCLRRGDARRVRQALQGGAEGRQGSDR